MTAVRDELRPAGPVAGGGRRIPSWLRQRWRSAVVLGPLLILAGLWQYIGMAGAPQRIDDEGTYVAQAYAVQTFHSLGHYTYWYDHPPLGWIQIAAYTWSTDAFGREPNAVLAGREAMLFVQLISCVLLWVVCRRLLMHRWAAGLAVAVFSLSPLAVQFHRTVYLDNVATPWILGAIVLALTPQRRLWAYAGSGLCFAIAVLTKETSLLLLPMYAYLVWRGSVHSASRRFAVSLAASTFLIAGSFYVVYAVVKNELLPGANHVSLVNGIRFQLFTRQASGSIFSSGTLTRAHLDQWLHLDPVTPLLAVVCVLPALLVRRLRPIAVGLLVLVATMAKPGYLPVPFVIGILPLAVIVIAGTADAGASWVPARWKTRPARRARFAPFLPLVVVGGLAAAAVAVPAWEVQQRGLFRSDLDLPVAQAESWIEANIPRTDRLTVDDAIWVDLDRAGFPRSNVVWYYKVDTDPAVERLSPDGWRDYDYVVSTQSLRTDPEAAPQVNTALRNSVVYATFGTGPTRVEIRRVMPNGLTGVTARTDADRAAQAAAGTALLADPDVRADRAARGVLARGQLDLRAATSLVTLSSAGPVSIHDLAADPGETAAGLPVRTLQLTAPDVVALTTAARALPEPYRPIAVQPLSHDTVRLTWAPDAAPITP